MFLNNQPCLLIILQKRRFEGYLKVEETLPIHNHPLGFYHQSLMANLLQDSTSDSLWNIHMSYYNAVRAGILAYLKGDIYIVFNYIYLYASIAINILCKLAGYLFD